MSDTMTCPISGKEINPGEGEAVMSRNGNMWVVHKSVPSWQRRTDNTVGPQTINGVKPISGPDSDDVR